jgi:transposase
MGCFVYIPRIGILSYREYKAAMAGGPVIYIGPAYTSQECPIWNHISRSNRPTSEGFECTCYGFSGLADTIASRNIAARVSVNMHVAARFFCGATSP